MSVLDPVVSFFKKVGEVVLKAFQAAHAAGLTDDLVKYGLQLVKVAATKFVDNGERRDFVIAALKSRGVPESLARLIVELAVQLFKKELAKVPDTVV